jgi:hypothetical protein
MYGRVNIYGRRENINFSMSFLIPNLKKELKMETNVNEIKIDITVLSEDFYLALLNQILESKKKAQNGI